MNSMYEYTLSILTIFEYVTKTLSFMLFSSVSIEDISINMSKVILIEKLHSRIMYLVYHPKVY